MTSFDSMGLIPLGKAELVKDQPGVLRVRIEKDCILQKITLTSQQLNTINVDSIYLANIYLGSFGSARRFSFDSPGDKVLDEKIKGRKLQAGQIIEIHLRRPLPGTPSVMVAGLLLVTT
jgi:hypothetical protein